MDSNSRKKISISLVAGLAFVGVTIAIVLIIFANSSALDIMTESDDRSKANLLYLYLFDENPSLAEAGMGAYYMLYENMTKDIGQISQPTFEQIHYAVSKEGVFKNGISNQTIERFSSVKIIVSDSIKKPDGSPLKEEDISPDARFYYSPYGRATMIMEDDGKMYVWTQDHYDNPNHLPWERMIGVVTLPVEASDYPRIQSNYDQIKERIESYQPLQVQSPAAIFVKEDATVIFADIDPSLKLIAETTNGRANIPSNDPTGPGAYLNDTNDISLKLYYGKNVSNGTEIVAVTMTNPSTTKSIRVDQLGLEGYVSIMDGNAESRLLDRPVISLPTNVTPPTFTKPVVILPGKSITAYMEDKSFVVDFYAAYACYFVDNDAIDPSTTKLQMNNHFCFHVKQQN